MNNKVQRKVRLNIDEIRNITLFESLTGAGALDCINEEDRIAYLVKKGEMGLAIGREGINIKRVKNSVGKDVWIVETADNAVNFIKNMFLPVKVRQIRINTVNNENTAIVEISKKDKKTVLGENKKILNIAKEFSKRHYQISDITVKLI